MCRLWRLVSNCLQEAGLAALYIKPALSAEALSYFSINQREHLKCSFTSEHCPPCTTVQYECRYMFRDFIFFRDLTFE